jgi:predicted DNA binding CopG/RHH family protein
MENKEPRIVVCVRIPISSFEAIKNKIKDTLSFSDYLRNLIKKDLEGENNV